MYHSGLMAPAENGRNEQIRHALRRLLDHPLFFKTKVLKTLLEYLVERALANATISESAIASTVFEIPAADFHPYTHTNVRVQMHNLRKKLELYYAEVPSETVRISLPENSYCPVFEIAGQVSAEVRRTLNQARFLAESRFPADLHDAMDLIDEVLAEAPTLGQAWAVRAEIHVMLAVHGEPPLASLRAAASARWGTARALGRGSRCSARRARFVSESESRADPLSAVTPPATGDAARESTLRCKARR